MSDATQPAGPLFPRWTNTAAKVTLAVLGGGAVGTIALLMVYVRSPLYTNQYQSVHQPVQFDHRHHVRDDGIDCRFCHTTVEKAATAGYPSTEICASCHGQIWNKSPYLEAIRASFLQDKPLEWRRVHDLRDYVYFNHAIHVGKGIGCVTCHGRVDEMPEIVKDKPMTMLWCLDCHRDPTRHIRPRDKITSMTWKPDDPEKTGRELALKYDVKPRTACSTCHR
jgi:hypothetical protein